MRQAYLPALASKRGGESSWMGDWTSKIKFESVRHRREASREFLEAWMGLGSLMFWMALGGIVCGLASYKTAKWAALVVAMASCVGARHVYATLALAAGDSWWSWLAKGIGGLWGLASCLLGFAAAGGLWFYARAREQSSKEES